MDTGRKGYKGRPCGCYGGVSTLRTSHFIVSFHSATCLLFCPSLLFSVMTVPKHPWWKEAVIYQIYPASFKDSNDDGVGDLPGVLSQIDYIKSLGADAIWICPMYKSPQYDMGYDISDYENIHPPYGTLEDMERIITACHEQGMRVLLDLVINHTSIEHDWFKESRSSKDNPKRGWYIWRSARYDADGCRKPPNNWASLFGGSAWEWDEHTQEYYLHLFCPEQPDINWENQETRQALYDTAMHFWLRKGVSGFRIDTVNLYSKVPGLPDAAIVDKSSEYQPATELFCNGPRMHEFLAEMHTVLSRYDATMTVGELPCTHERSQVLSYVSAAAKQLDMVFQFDIVNVGAGLGVLDRYDIEPGKSWTVPQLAASVARTQEIIGDSDGWVTAFLENHDQARSVSRWGSDANEEARSRSAKMLAILECSLSGTLFVYQGQEIGMVNAPLEWPIDEYKDVVTINHYREVKDKTNSDPNTLARTKGALQHLARDNARIPFSWNASANAGFTNADQIPWMRVHDNYKQVNAQSQLQDKDSVLSFWKRILQVRKENADVFVHGIFEPTQDQDKSVFVFEKRALHGTAIVALNFADTEQPLILDPRVTDTGLQLLISNYNNKIDGKLRPFEGCIWLTK
jgi:oligo-1,6-glucosidase